MIKKISRQKAIENFTKLPLRKYDEKEEEEYVLQYPKTFSYSVFTLPSKSYKGHVKMLGKELVNLTNFLGSKTLIFMGDLDTAWLQRWNRSDFFQESLQYLADLKLGKNFCGALQVDTTEMPDFIQHLVLLIKTNGVLQDVYFVDPEQQIVAIICQYGNLHISALSLEADNLFHEFLATSHFEKLTDEICFNRFSKSSKILGRTLDI